MADVSSATKFFPTAKEGFTTTTSGSVAPGATSVSLSSVSGLTNGDVMVFVIDPTDATKKQVFTGTVDTSGTQITNVIWTEGTNTTHSTGATVVDYETATHWALYNKGLLVAHEQTGVLKSGTVGTDNIVASSVTEAKIGTGAVTEAKLGTNSVSAAKLATSAIKLGHAEKSAAFSTTSTSATQITDLGVTVTIPSGGRSVLILVSVSRIFSATQPNNGVTLSLWDGTVGSGTQLAACSTDGYTVNNAGAPGNIMYVHTPSAGSKTYNVGLAAVTGGTATIQCAASVPATLVVLAI